MKLSISNIAWSATQDREMYTFLSESDVRGLEIAPTRIFPKTPYEQLDKAKQFSHMLEADYGLAVSSMQSIWFGVPQRLFGTDAARRILVDYTKRAIDFAAAMRCPNLVFGCPKNRVVPDDMTQDVALSIAHEFFREIGDWAAKCGTCIALEPNPPIYNTNFINTTQEAIALCNGLNHPGVQLNLDLGALIYNEEDIQLIRDNIDLVNHVHISEPHLRPIEKRQLHTDLLKTLQELNYSKFVSIEMGAPEDLASVKAIVLYMGEVLDDLS